MIDNDLFKNDKENYYYILRTNLMDLFIESKYLINFNLKTLNILSKKALQDQFRKFRDHFENSQ